MASEAPDMHWLEIGSVGGWKGLAPEWPIPRPRPGGLDSLLLGRRLELSVEYLQAHPAVAPTLNPLNPIPPRERRFAHAWHLNGDGTLCLLSRASDWRLSDTAADLVVKASGWFIEYLLKERGLISAISDTGLYDDDRYDALLDGLS
jgi:hypothetical protein